ncbi:hypothetical protein K1719_033966 [Acacia pycnantha]|nr:hypothetical protein K1719_033966 [Acacia pycnantha]
MPSRSNVNIAGWWGTTTPQATSHSLTYESLFLFALSAPFSSSVTHSLKSSTGKSKLSVHLKGFMSRTDNWFIWGECGSADLTEIPPLLYPFYV